MGKQVLVPIAQGTEEMEAVIIIDMLRRAGFNVKIAGENEITTCSKNVKIIPDILIDSIDESEEFDAIILPGGITGTQNLMDNQNLIKILKKHNQEKKLIGAICAAPTILLEHKLIPIGAELTSHPSVADKFVDYQHNGAKFVQSQNLIFGKGAGTAFDFSLAIIKELSGEEMAENIKNAICYNE